jgi:hypothetical protein
VDGRFISTNCKKLLFLAVICSAGLFLLNRVALEMECGSALLLLVVRMLYVFVLT